MPRAHLQVLCPQPFQKQPAASYPTGTPTNYFVVASGRVRGTGGKLTACLIDRINRVAYFANPVVKTGSLWSAAFPGLPMKVATYLLVVTQTDADLTKTGNLVATVEFEVVAPHSGSKGDIPIQYPGPGDTVCPSFSAYGSDGTGGPTTTAKLQDGTPVSNSTPVPGLPAGTWMFQFTNVKNDTYKLIVSNASQQGENDGIIVSSDDCTPIGAPPPPPPL